MNGISKHLADRQVMRITRGKQACSLANGDKPVTMKTLLFRLLITGILLSVSGYSWSQRSLNAFEQAKRHDITCAGPAPDFFEGALIGNGGMGAVVCSRPDAVVIRFGHNDVWDIRIAEDNKDEIGTFQDVFEKVKAIDPNLKNLEDDPWYAKYKLLTRANYAKPYPRPFPCGSLILGFDRRKLELIGHSLDLSDGLVSVKFLQNRKDTVFLKLFTDMKKDRLWMKLVDNKGKSIQSCFNRINVIPDAKTPEDFPAYRISKLANGIAFKQILPYQEPKDYLKEKGHPKDKSLILSVVTSNLFEKRQRLDRLANTVDMEAMEFAMLQEKHFWMCIDLRNGLAKGISEDFSELTALGEPDFDVAYTQSVGVWKEFWSRSAVFLDDKELESVWYKNLYFLNCAAKSGVSCPGLFANWSFNEIGTAWHGDWHMNYNTQQPFWATFSSNHLELNLPYVEMIEFISDVAKKWAKDYYRMRGAFYPHSAYPVDMTMNPYPVPDWGWEVFETPWAVQGVWWHYLYSGDKEFLKSRAFPLMKDAVLFLVDYMSRAEAHGDQWNDKKYHIFPTVPPELYKLRPGFKFNSDGLADLTLIKFLFNAYLKSIDILELKTETETSKAVKDILRNYPDYPTGISKEYGEVFVSVKGESTETVYNAPCNLMTVFPGEDHGLHSEKETMDILANTKRNNQNEGGNDLVFQHLQAARIGMLDLELFKRAVDYCTLENGTCSDFMLQVNGRYSDHTNPKFMEKMGIWFENFGLPAVINECLMQSYTGTIRLFPNWPVDQNAAFKTLRAAGGFLVSSSIKKGTVADVEITGENENELRLYNPWGADAKIKVVTDLDTKFMKGDILRLKVRAGQKILFQAEKEY